MDARASLILTRAKELLARDAPGARWLDTVHKPGHETIERQGTYLSLAEHQLLVEGRIESVDQT